MLVGPVGFLEVFRARSMNCRFYSLGLNAGCRG